MATRVPQSFLECSTNHHWRTCPSLLWPRKGQCDPVRCKPRRHRLCTDAERKRVVIETDHKPLESIWKNTIPSASPRLQRLLLKMEVHEIHTRQNKRYCWCPFQSLLVGNSRRSRRTPSRSQCDYKPLPASTAKLDEIRNQSSQDIVPSHPEDVIHQGWPEYPNECPSVLKEFWNFREELNVENGLSI